MRVILPLLLATAMAERPTVPVTFDLAIASYADVCRQLREKTNLPFDCATNIKDRKATLLCEKIPADQVMARMAEGMFVRFEPRGTGFLLIADPDVSTEESRYERAQTEARRSAAKKAIGRLAAFAKMPADARKAEAEELRQKMKEAKTSEEKSAFASELALREPMERGDRSMWDAGYVLGQLSSGEIDALLDGQPIVADNAELGTGRNLPADAYAYGMPSSEGQGIMGILQYRPETGQLNFSQRTMPTEQGGGGAMMRGIPIEGGVPSETALSERISAWREGRDPAVDALALQEGEPPVAVSPTKTFSMIEHFRWLHARSGVPIVAEVTRSSVSFPEPFAAKTVGEWMKESHMRREYSHNWTLYNYRTSRGWLMARPGGVSRLRKIEVPERGLIPYAAKPELTVDEMARFAGSLTDDQSLGLSETTWAYPLPLAQIKMALGSLQVYDSLGAQKRAAFSPDGVSIEAMPFLAKQKLHALFMRRLLGGWPEPSLVPFLTGAARLDSVPMSFRAEKSTVGTMIDEEEHDLRKGSWGGTGKNYDSLTFKATLAGQSYSDFLPLKLREDR